MSVIRNRFRVSSLLASRLTELGVALPALLQRAGLPAEFFRQEKITANTDELFAMWRAIGEATGDPGIGLKLGSESRLERFDPSAIAALCSQSFRDALQRMARYKQLTCPEEIRIRSRCGETSIEFVFLQGAGQEPAILVDLCLAWVFAIGTRGTGGRVRPMRVELARKAGQRELFEAHFGCPVKFGAARNALVFPSVHLDQPFVTHNADLLAMVGAQLEQELSRQAAEVPLADRVKQTLKRTLAGRRPAIGLVAGELGLSSRTLQRRLTGDGLTFQQVVENARRELARHYLGQSAIELNETAYLLGYEDANSFFRAFQDWEGTTPGNWRARHGERMGLERGNENVNGMRPT